MIQFLKELKYSYYLNAKIYTEGSCFRLYKIIKTIYPQANPYYSHIEGHWITEIDGKYYDINGEINKDFVEEKEYRIIKNEITLASAYVPTYKGQCSSYKKYNKTI